MTPLLILGVSISTLAAAEVMKLWPGDPPGKKLEVGPETDFTKETDNKVGGKRLIRLGNVATPEVHVFKPADDKNTGAAVVICPGGGFSILAWDLEGTEVAQWLNELGVTAVVLKYRVPTRSHDVKWLAPVQDCQRALSLTRQHASEWKIDPERIGVLGFSAGGKTAAVAAVETKRLYEPIDKNDEVSHLPNFAVLVYAAYLLNEEKTGLAETFAVTAKTPPMFLVHAFDDRVPVEGALQMMLALKKAGVASELHVYDTGGHGYGLRPNAEAPVASWPVRCEDWLRRGGWLKAKKDSN